MQLKFRCPAIKPTAYIVRYTLRSRESFSVQFETTRSVKGFCPWKLTPWLYGIVVVRLNVAAVLLWLTAHLVRSQGID